MGSTLTELVTSSFTTNPAGTAVQWDYRTFGAHFEKDIGAGWIDVAAQRAKAITEFDTAAPFHRELVMRQGDGNTRSIVRPIRWRASSVLD